MQCQELGVLSKCAVQQHQSSPVVCFSVAVFMLRQATYGCQPVAVDGMTPVHAIVPSCTALTAHVQLCPWPMLLVCQTSGCSLMGVTGAACYILALPGQLGAWHGLLV